MVLVNKCTFGVKESQKNVTLHLDERESKRCRQSVIIMYDPQEGY